MNDHDVIVKFGKGYYSDVQGKILLALERWIREHELLPAWRRLV